MVVRIRLFAVMAQMAGAGSVMLELPDGSPVQAIRPALERQFAKMAWPAGTMLAVNQEYAGENVILQSGDEVAIIPPVSGG